MLERLNALDFEDVFRLMALSFPENEYRTREDQRALLDDPDYRLYGLRGEAGVSALCAVWALSDRLFIEHLAVDPSQRNGGVGGRFLDDVIAACKMPAVLEVEPPETEMARRRIGFYQRHGFFLNDYEYYQPPMRAGQEKLPLLLMTTGAPLNRGEFEALRRDIYARVYKADARGDKLA